MDVQILVECCHSRVVALLEWVHRGESATTLFLPRRQILRRNCNTYGKVGVATLRPLEKSATSFLVTGFKALARGRGRYVSVHVS